MMNNIGTLYTYELKKIANRKLVWIVGMIMIALSMFLSVSDLVTSSSYYGETSVSAYQAMKFNKDNAEELSGMAIDDTLLREMQEDCANESKDHTKVKQLHLTTKLLLISESVLTILKAAF